MIGGGRRPLLGCMCSCAAMALAGCTVPQNRTQTLAPGHRPTLSSREGALWKLMEEEEARIARSRFRMREANVEGYVGDIACRLAGNYCPDIRVYVIRTPYFNASMAPNGMMQVWSGLLLRTQNEAQLAAVIGHELGHYLQRHSLERLEDLMAKADVSAFLGMGLAAAGVGNFAILSDLVLIASIFAYSRDQEREADAMGLEIMSKAGYPPVEASRIWSQIVAEEEADPDAEMRNVFFATHPDPEDRQQVLAQKARTTYAGVRPTAPDRLREALLPLRHELLEDEGRLNQEERTLALLDIMRANGNEDAPALYLRGEIHRQRGERADLAKARDLYHRALAMPDAPDEAWRSLGLVERKLGDDAAARRAYARYLELVPEAPDRAIIEPYVGGEA